MELEYLLDTNICIYIAKNKPISILKKFTQLNVGQVAMSFITYAELLYGVEKSHHKKQNLEILENLCSLIPPISMSMDVAQNYAQIRSKLELKGTLIGNNDLWIAAHCVALGVTLVTNNTKEFSRVPHLKSVNWI